jgi:hypothetical protein
VYIHGKQLSLEFNDSVIIKVVYSRNKTEALFSRLLPVFHEFPIIRYLVSKQLFAMIQMKVFLVLSVSVINSIHSDSKPRLQIINGQRVNSLEIPYQLKYFSGEMFVCGASIISETFALSAGESR